MAGWRLGVPFAMAVAVVAGVALHATSRTGAQAQNPPVPRPFPGTSTPTTSPPPKPADPAGTTSTGAPKTNGQTPAPQTPQPSAGTNPAAQYAYPGAEFLDSFDAGRGQRFYLFGTNAPFADIVLFYKNQQKTGGRELFKTPAMQQFDLGKFDEDTMAFPPSVVVKDYTWENSAGYLYVKGTTEKRYRTVIQIVPPTVR
jgi:hypothetical protein